MDRFLSSNSATERALFMFDEKMWICNSMTTDYSRGNIREMREMRDFLNYNKLMDVSSSRSRLILNIVFRPDILPAH